MKKQINKSEFLKLTDAEKCRVMIEIALGNLKYMEDT